MIDYEDEYKKATENAVINTYNEISRFNWNALFLNMVLLSAFIGIGYFTIIYLKKETTFSHKTSVMGVSHTVGDEGVDGNNVNINDALSDIVNTSTLRDDSLYIQTISKEIDKENDDAYTNTIAQEMDKITHKNLRTIVVKKGDTLASIAQKYYGNSMAFDKIIESNSELTTNSHIINIGQKLYLPY